MKLTANVSILNLKFFFSAIISEVEYKWTFNFFESWRFWQFFLNHSFCVITVTLLTSVLLEIDHFATGDPILSCQSKTTVEISEIETFSSYCFLQKKKSSYSTFLPKISRFLAADCYYQNLLFCTAFSKTKKNSYWILY